MLLIDDVQFLTGHRETQTELLRIFNALTADGRQIVMSSDRPPVEIADVDERLITRLSGGLIVDMGAPDYETRMAILNAKCEERGVRFRGGVIEEVGRIEFKNVRELQGALNRLIASQTLGGEQIVAEAVRGILGDLADQRPRATPPKALAGEFQNFLSDISLAVAQHVEQWKTRLTEAIDYWTSEGYRTASLERVLQVADAADERRDRDARIRGDGHQAPRPRDADRPPRRSARRDTTRCATPTASPRRSSCSSARCARRRRRRDRRQRSRAPGSKWAAATSSPCAPPTRSSPCRAAGTIRSSSTGRAALARRT